MKQPIILAATTARNEGSIEQATSRLINCYAESDDEGGQVIRSAPGMTEIATIGSGPVRALVGGSDGIYGVAGGTLTQWDGTAAYTRATVPDSITTMATDGVRVGLTAGNKLYLWDGALTQAIGMAFDNAGSVEHMRGYWLASQADGDAYAYALGDGKSFDALDFASAEYKFDKLRRILVSGGLVWMMGASTIEPWQLTGDANLPFQALPSTVIDKGIRSTNSAAVLDNTIQFVSDEGRLYRADNFRPVNVSTNALAASLRENTDHVLVPWQWENHDFLSIRFASRPAWTYDVGTRSYSERMTGIGYEGWDVTASCQYDGQWYYGTSDGKLCRIGGYQDRGEELRREITSRNFRNGLNRSSISSLTIDATGTGQMMFRHSTDSGRNWSNERQYPIGDQTQINGLGQGRRHAVSIAVTDNTDFSIHEVSVE